MSRAISIGKNAMRNAYPNPMVGCVIVHENNIISEGFTSPYGGNHAEVNAIEKLENKDLLKQATLYVTLEPCAHYGKTPPCANLITAHGIPRVVIGMLDPNPLVSGKGIELLEKAGVQVQTGVLEAACASHHKRFLSVQNNKRPYIILKWAQSADAYIAPPKENRSPYWISSSMSTQKTHLWRSQEHAILIGANTVIEDQPSLDVRLCSGLNPIPIYLDRNLSVPQSAPFFHKHQTVYCVTDLSSDTPTNTKVQYLKIDYQKPIAQQVCNKLTQIGISSVMVEGGTKTLDHFIKENLWDEARIFKSEKKLGDGVKAPELNGISVKNEIIEGDELTYITPYI